jgi:ATP-dependent Clp protease ATP-binding subunit ClpA
MRKPVGTFLFLGTTGVGKTELAIAGISLMTRNDDTYRHERIPRTP